MRLFTGDQRHQEAVVGTLDAANDDLLVPLDAAERDQFTGLLIRISGTEG